MTSKNKSLGFLYLVLSVMIGLICALFGVIISNLAFVLWDWMSGIPDAGSIPGVIFGLQRLALFIVFAAAAGVLSTRFLKNDRREAIVSGAVAGASMAVLLFLLLALLILNPVVVYDMLSMSLPPYLVSPSLYDYSGDQQQRLGVITHAWPMLLTMLILFIAVAAYAAYWSCFGRKGRRRKEPRSPFVEITMLILAVLLLPAAVVAAAVSEGGLPHPTQINYEAQLVTNENPNATVIAAANAGYLDFTLLDSPGARYLATGEPFTMLINGRAATNQSLASASGLQVVVDPPQGLSSARGSTLRITGINTSDQVEISANFRDGSHKVIIRS